MRLQERLRVASTDLTGNKLAESDTAPRGTGFIREGGGEGDNDALNGPASSRMNPHGN